MPAQSKAQQRFMGMVHATQTGAIKAPSKEVAEAAKGMKPSSAKDFAKTKHTGLPEHKPDAKAAAAIPPPTTMPTTRPVSRSLLDALRGGGAFNQAPTNEAFRKPGTLIRRPDDPSLKERLLQALKEYAAVGREQAGRAVEFVGQHPLGVGGGAAALTGAAALAAAMRSGKKKPKTVKSAIAVRRPELDSGKVEQLLSIIKEYLSAGKEQAGRGLNYVGEQGGRAYEAALPALRSAYENVADATSAAGSRVSRAISDVPPEGLMLGLPAATVGAVLLHEALRGKKTRTKHSHIEPASLQKLALSLKPTLPLPGSMPPQYPFRPIVSNLNTGRTGFVPPTGVLPQNPSTMSNIASTLGKHWPWLLMTLGGGGLLWNMLRQKPTTAGYVLPGMALAAGMAGQGAFGDLGRFFRPNAAPAV